VVGRRTGRRLRFRPWQMSWRRLRGVSRFNPRRFACFLSSATNSPACCPLIRRPVWESEIELAELPVPVATLRKRQDSLPPAIRGQHSAVASCMSGQEKSIGHMLDSESSARRGAGSLDRPGGGQLTQGRVVIHVFCMELPDGLPGNDGEPSKPAMT